jgi:hypothetical protein
MQNVVFLMKDYDKIVSLGFDVKGKKLPII